MTRSNASYTPQPMRIQARPGSLAERRYYHNSALPKGGWPKPEVIAPGISPKPLDDLIFHGGKIVPQMEFQNVFLGGQASWQASDIDSINSAITLAMQDRRLNNVIKQYFVDIASLACDPRTSVVLEEPNPGELDEPDVQQTVVRLLKERKLSDSGLDTVIFNLLLPPGCVLRLGDSDSMNGLGGYHGSVHFDQGGKSLRAYYSANVFSQRLPDGGRTEFRRSTRRGRTWSARSTTSSTSSAPMPTSGTRSRTRRTHSSAGCRRRARRLATSRSPRPKRCR